jgi:hypothetical protein
LSLPKLGFIIILSTIGVVFTNFWIDFGSDSLKTVPQDILAEAKTALLNILPKNLPRSVSKSTNNDGKEWQKKNTEDAILVYF